MLLPMKLPQFTLRDLFWLVLVVALAVGWFVDRTRLVQQINRLDHWIEKWLPFGTPDQIH